MNVSLPSPDPPSVGPEHPAGAGAGRPRHRTEAERLHVVPEGRQGRPRLRVSATLARRQTGDKTAGPQGVSPFWRSGLMITAPGPTAATSTALGPAMMIMTSSGRVGEPPHPPVGVGPVPVLQRGQLATQLHGDRTGLAAVDLERAFGAVS